MVSVGCQMSLKAGSLDALHSRRRRQGCGHERLDVTSLTLNPYLLLIVVEARPLYYMLSLVKGDSCVLLNFSQKFDMEFKDKVALVTGGASGYGKAYCEELVKQGCKVSICDINTEAGEELLRNLSKQYKDRVIFFSCDVTDYPQFEEAFHSTITKLGGIDIVINNASMMNDRLWELEVDVNLNGVIRGLLLAFRFLGRDRGGRGGVVINAGSSCSSQPMISLPVFTATKHAIGALTRCYGNQYHVNLTGVRVLSICTPPTESTLSGDSRKRRLLSSEYEQAWQTDKRNITSVKPEYAAKSLMDIIKKAPSGTTWLFEDSNTIKELTLFPVN